MTRPTPDRTEIMKALSILHGSTQTIELRAIDKKKRIHAGYFDQNHHKDFADAAIKLNMTGSQIYMVMNPVNPQLMSRCCNRVAESPKCTANDGNVISRSWFYVDVDPVRPADTSSTSEQLQASSLMAMAIWDYLTGLGWPDPIFAASGNGYHLVYRLADLSNTDENTTVIKSVLLQLSKQFNTEYVHVDTTVSNAARIMKLYGTVAGKGDHTDFAPHRLSKIISAPETPLPVPLELLRGLAPAPVKASAIAVDTTKRSEFNIHGFLSKLGTNYTETPYNGGTRYLLDECPFNIEHGRGESAIFQHSDGKLGFKCQHDSCADKHWQDVRSLIDGPREQRQKCKEPFEVPVWATKNSICTVKPPERFTDTELAERFAELFPDNIRYWTAVKKWLVYDGRRWTSDTPGGGFPFVKAMVNQIRKSVFEIEDHELQIKMLKQVLKLESHPRQEILLSAAAVLPPLIISADKLDSNKMLLNCLNGTLDLVTGDLRAHSPDDHITRMVQIEYDSSATCPLFDKFLSRIMGDNSKLTDYIRRFVGYCLTGLTTEQVFLFMWGVGCNGKSTLLEVLENLLGDLASTASSDLLMTQQRGAATNDLAALRGARLVKISEFNENAKLDSARLKTLTGGDRITCRYLYCEPFEYTPEYKIIMAGNSKPRITETDHGTWRRFHLLPFQVIIPEEERDNHLSAKLRAELPGILAWAVRGCMEWQRVGLCPPDEVKAAVADYKKGEDTFHNWLDECCVRGAELWATSKQLLESYQEFTGNRFITATKFGRLLSDSNFVGVSKFSGKAWQGLGLSLPET